MPDYDKMTDRELDALVAERVMGWTDEDFCRATRFEFAVELIVADDGPRTNIVLCKALRDIWASAREANRPHEIPKFSTDIAAAWTVAERVVGSRHVRCNMIFGSHMRPSAEFFDVETGQQRFGASADTMPRAICIAALTALDAQEKTNGS